MKKGFSYIEVLVSMFIWALVSLFFLQIALSSILNMKRAEENMRFREAINRARISSKGKYRRVRWERKDNILTVYSGGRKLVLKRRRKNEEGIRIFPR